MRRIKAKELFFHAHNLESPQMKDAYRNYGANE